MNSSVPMIDLSSGDDEEVDYAMMRSYLPMPGPSDGEMEVPSLLFGNGNLCRSTLSINQPSMAPSPFSEITVSSQRPLVARSGSNSSEHTALMKEALKKKPVADIAHVISTTLSANVAESSESLPPVVKIQNLPLIPSYLSLQEEPFSTNPSSTSSGIPKSSSTGAMPRRPPLLRLAPVPEDEEDDEVFLEGQSSDDKQRFLPLRKPRRFHHSSLLDSEDVVNNSDDETVMMEQEQENKRCHLVSSSHASLRSLSPCPSLQSSSSIGGCGGGMGIGGGGGGGGFIGASGTSSTTTRRNAAIASTSSTTSSTAGRRASAFVRRMSMAIPTLSADPVPFSAINSIYQNNHASKNVYPVTVP
ncbi:hypothetical protein GCK72_008887 [Caenorhabditis remanei]|uniref:Uncharacterized protein n=1 Tax=Caenorhabditis remanei TaxID=31234 RepID=A0A6A5GYS9_CAERE|nr:hypothetical protein GCK72_008887 [Caenorhabditis remanei]KAF1760638.1 hypothetical protein GCK72_008887 [Caenorhabditis remanei]